jgi:hypothetical protein
VEVEEDSSSGVAIRVDGELALMRAFLGKVGGCLVPESTFVAGCLDNPQIGQRLVRVATSPRFPGAVVCGRVGATGEVDARVAGALGRLGASVRGAALAGLLGGSGFQCFEAGMIGALDGLVAGAAADRGAGPVTVGVGAGTGGEAGEGRRSSPTPP